MSPWAYLFSKTVLRGKYKDSLKLHFVRSSFFRTYISASYHRRFNRPSQNIEWSFFGLHIFLLQKLQFRLIAYMLTAYILDVFQFRGLLMRNNNYPLLAYLNYLWSTFMQQVANLCNSYLMRMFLTNHHFGMKEWRFLVGKKRMLVSDFRGG